MRIPEFSIANHRNIRFAACETVPPVMIVTGPNGCGKSTLLQQLRGVGGGRRPMYIGPHRASRRQQVRFRFLGPEINMRRVLEGESLPGYEGIQNIGSARTPWDHDDAPSYLKYGLCQIELDRREAIATRYDQHSEIQRGSIPDVWQPLREMAENLLPHMKFDKIDTTNRDKVRCLWQVHDQPESIDIDDLSSGEKSIVQLFYPLVEHRIKGILHELKGDEALQGSEKVCVLMDEPKLHLHPNLQSKVLDYIRGLSVRENAQFIMATHSPTIVENANSDELFLLRPTEMIADGDNQLVRIATDEEKLQLLRDVFGSTSNLTAMRPILVVESKKDDQKAKRAVDSRIYAFLSDEFSRITIIPSGGKAECKKLAANLTEILQGFSADLRAYALLDRDVEVGESDDPSIHLLPVSMVENLLVDPHVIWQATVLVHHKMTLTNPESIEAALDEILSEMEDAEIARRVKAETGTRTFRLEDPIEDAEEQIQAFVNTLKSELSPDRIAKLKKESARKVESIKSNNQRREFFHGKKILDDFFKRHLHSTGMSKEIFIYDCARQANERNSVRRFVGELASSIGLRPTDATDPAPDQS